MTGVWEMADVAGIGVEVDLDAVPVLPESRTLCEVCALDIYRTITSGTLLAAVAPTCTAKLLRAYRRAGIRAAVVGRFVAKRRQFRQDGRTGKLLPSAQDEITKIFD